MSGAVTMKMISSTSITSTIGVTLISLIVTRPPPLPPWLVPIPMVRTPGYLKKCRFTMFRKSAEKFDISVSNTRIRLTNEL